MLASASSPADSVAAPISAIKPAKKSTAKKSRKKENGSSNGFNSTQQLNSRSSAMSINSLVNTEEEGKRLSSRLFDI